MAGGAQGETQPGGQGRTVSKLRSDGRIRHWHGQAGVGDSSWGSWGPANRRLGMLTEDTRTQWEPQAQQIKC